MDVPIHSPRMIILDLQRRRDVRVDPKRPERVIEVEDEHFRQREAVFECFGGDCIVAECAGRLAGDGRCAGLFDHDGGDEVEER